MSICAPISYSFNKINFCKHNPATCPNQWKGINIERPGIYSMEIYLKSDQTIQEFPFLKLHKPDRWLDNCPLTVTKDEWTFVETTFETFEENDLLTLIFDLFPGPLCISYEFIRITMIGKREAKGFVVSDFEGLGYPADFMWKSSLDESCLLLKKQDGLYQFERKGQQALPFQWVGCEFVPEAFDCDFTFDILFLSEVPIASDDDFCVAQQSTKYSSSWLSNCQQNDWVSVTIPMKLFSLNKVLFVFLADHYLKPIKFQVKNMKLQKQSVNPVRTTIVLTTTVRVNWKKICLHQTDPSQRIATYLKSIRQWLQKTNLNIVVVENAGYTFPELDFEKEDYKDRFQVLTFVEERLPKAAYLRENDSKGASEIFAINYAFENSALMRDTNFIVKFTGRYFVPEFEDYLQKFNLDNYDCLVQNERDRCEIVGSHISKFAEMFDPFLIDENNFYNGHIEAIWKMRGFRFANTIVCKPFPIEPTPRGGCNDTFFSL